MSETIFATCESCGHESSHPWSRRGRIGQCPHCFESVDVPDPGKFIFHESAPCDFPTDEVTGLTFTFEEGFPRPNWQAVIDQHPMSLPVEQSYWIWSRAADVWLSNVLRVLPKTYSTASTDNFVLLSALDSQSSDRFLGRCEEFRGKIMDQLYGCVGDVTSGKHVVLCFDDSEAYYAYVSNLYDDGEYGGSLGMAIRDLYMHIAMPYIGSEWERTLAHELTHILSFQLPIPGWLHEGVAQLVDGSLIGGSRFRPTHGSIQKQRVFWNEHGIDEFLTGQSFRRPDEGQEHSYQLSEMLVRNLVSDSRDKFKQYLANARAEDAGDAAMRICFGCSIIDRIEEILGDGTWKSRHESMSDAIDE